MVLSEHMALELVARQVVVEQMASELPVKLVELLAKLVVEAFFATAHIGGVSYQGLHRLQLFLHVRMP